MRPVQIACTLSAIWGALLLGAGGARAQTDPTYEPIAAQGLSPAATRPLPDGVEAVVERLFSEPGALEQTRALVVVHNGDVLLERHAPGYGPDQRHISWSMAKSVAHATVGRLIELGLVESRDSVMPTPFPEGDPRASRTWHHWLSMTDGLDYVEISEEELPLDDQDVVQMMYGPGRFDVVGWIVDNLPAAHPAGTRWNYSTAGYHLIGWAVQDAIGTTGDPAGTSAWLERELFAPLGMDAVAEYDAAGTLLAGSLVYAPATDYAKFGELYRLDGVLPTDALQGSERFLPEGWVDYARTGELGDDHNIYGAGFWLAPEVSTAPRNQMSAPFDAFHAGGHEGQTIWIVPSRNLTVVRLGLMENSDAAWGGLFEANQEMARGFREVAATPNPSP